MAEFKFKNLFIMFIVVGIFAFSMINFAVNFASDNELDQSINENQAINNSFSRLSTQFGDAERTANIQRDAVENETIQAPEGEFILSTAITSVFKFGSTITGFFNSMLGLIAGVLGIPPVVLGGIVTILVAMLVLLGWRTWKVGD